jgi:hypothetical protein
MDLTNMRLRTPELKMKRQKNAKKATSEAGAALLIAIFALLLISVIAIALVVSSGTDSALASNYRTSTEAYYAALAGLEEGRGRMLWSNPNFINTTIPNYVPNTTSPPMGLPQVLYIINPANGETVAPWDTGNPATYPDNEYIKEFGMDVGSANVQLPPLTSVSPLPGLPGSGPMFKWVRITPATEKSLNVDVDQLHPGGPYDATTLIYYDPAYWSPGTGFKPSLINLSNPPGAARQGFQITALAVVPPNTQKLLQYVVTPLSYGLYFHAALVVPGSTTITPTITYHGPDDPAFKISGIDGSGTPPPIPGCVPSLIPPYPAGFGVSDYTGPAGTNINAVLAGIPSAPPPGMGGNYIWSGSPTSPSVQDVTVNAAMQTPASLTAMVQQISLYADKNLPGNSTDTDLSAITNSTGPMSQTNAMTVVVNGNLTINHDYTGYGLLVVTGDLVATADFGWKGVVMVVGSGNVTLGGGTGGISEFDGAFFVAHTLNTSASPVVPLAALGPVTFDASAAKSRGIYYNSCWIDAALRPPSYQVISFRELVSQ